MGHDGPVRRDRTAAYLALAGILTGAAGIITSQATVWALGATNAPVSAVASAVRDLTPGPLAARLVHLVGHLDRTPGGLESVHHELAAVRRRKGIAILDGLPGTGISSMATVIPGPRGPRPLAAISVVRRGHLPLPVVGPLLLAAARTTSRTLYPDWVPSKRGAVLRLA